MKKPYDQHENVVGKALCDLIQIFQEIDRDTKNKTKGNPDEITLRQGKKKTKVKL